LQVNKSKRNKKWWVLNIVLPAIGLVIVSEVIIQILVPYDRTLPFARVGEVNIGSKSVTEAARILQKGYAIQPVSVYAGKNKIYVTSAATAGLVPNYTPALNWAIHYPLWQRLVPFSIVYKAIKNDIPLSHKLDNDIFDIFAEKVAAKCNQPAKDAGIEFKDNNVVITKSSVGRECSKDNLRIALDNVDLRGMDLNIKPEITSVSPKIDDNKVQTIKQQVDTILLKHVVIKSTSDNWEVDSKTLISWLKIQQHDSKIELIVDEVAVKGYLDTLRGRLYIEPGTTVMRYVDGVKVSGDSGSNGQGLDVDVTAQRVSDVILGRESGNVAWVQLAVLPPKQISGRSYTPTPQGVAALVAQWKSEHSGRYGVIVHDLSGKGLSAELNPDSDFVTASTFKMFLAYALLHKVEINQLSLSTPTDQGLSAGDCLTEMIYHSTNPCAISITNLVGWDYAHQFINQQFPHTLLNNKNTSDGDKHSTVRDETNFLEKLNAGELMNNSNTQLLLNLMKKQVWRDGIPAGVRGITVADKVGFYNGYRHDVALIYAPRGTYILGIMSQGGSESSFADLSQRLYALMSQN
jgi:beta-lactamase class A